MFLLKPPNLLLWLMTCSYVFSATPKDWCVFRNTHTKVVYNLNSLKSDSDYKWQTVNQQNKTINWYMNMCHNVTTFFCGLDAVACQEWDENNLYHGMAALGVLNTMQLSEAKSNNGQGVSVNFGSGTEGRSFEVEIICDPGAGKGKPAFIREHPTLHYIFEWKSNVVCTRKLGGLSTGSILCIGFAVLLTIYIGGGILINKYVRHQEGIALFPNLTLWMAFPGLVRDGFLFVANKILGRTGYVQV